MMGLSERCDPRQRRESLRNDERGRISGIQLRDHFQTRTGWRRYLHRNHSAQLHGHGRINGGRRRAGCRPYPRLFRKSIWNYIGRDLRCEQLGGWHSLQV